MKTKFAVGDKVIAPDGELGEIVSVHIDENGVWYTMTSKEVDVPRREIIEGFKHLTEDELKEAPREKAKKNEE